MYCNRHITEKSVSFSGSLWLRKAGIPVFPFQFFFGQKMMAWKKITAKKVDCFHSKKHKEHYIVFMFNYEVLSLELDRKKVQQKLLELFFTYIQTMIHYKFQFCFHTCFGVLSPLLICK